MFRQKAERHTKYPFRRATALPGSCLGLIEKHETADSTQQRVPLFPLMFMTNLAKGMNHIKPTVNRNTVPYRE